MKDKRGNVPLIVGIIIVAVMFSISGALNSYYEAKNIEIGGQEYNIGCGLDVAEAFCEAKGDRFQNSIFSQENPIYLDGNTLFVKCLENTWQIHPIEFEECKL